MERKTFEEFLNDHPEIKPEWREIIEPIIQGADDSVYKFIMTYIFM